MKWIKTADQLPPYGKTVLVLVNHPITENKLYKLGLYCCMGIWEIDSSTKYQYVPIMWSELPPIEPE